MNEWIGRVRGLHCSLKEDQDWDVSGWNARWLGTEKAWSSESSKGASWLQCSQGKGPAQGLEKGGGSHRGSAGSAWEGAGNHQGRTDAEESKAWHMYDAEGAGEGCAKKPDAVTGFGRSKAASKASQPESSIPLPPIAPTRPSSTEEVCGVSSSPADHAALIKAFGQKSFPPYGAATAPELSAPRPIQELTAQTALLAPAAPVWAAPPRPPPPKVGSKFISQLLSRARAQRPAAGDIAWEGADAAEPWAEDSAALAEEASDLGRDAASWNAQVHADQWQLLHGAAAPGRGPTLPATPRADRRPPSSQASPASRAPAPPPVPRRPQPAHAGGPQAQGPRGPRPGAGSPVGPAGTGVQLDVAQRPQLQTLTHPKGGWSARPGLR